MNIGTLLWNADEHERGVVMFTLALERGLSTEERAMAAEALERARR